LSKLVKKTEIKLGALKELVISLGKMNLRFYVQNLIKIRGKWERYRGHKPKSELNRK